ncbi:uncharacterized protein LOC114528384 [Dendronephthya gigantea]|uniref:uncharacterized protein LOC114528384 n=1 Tax=Dendronephthya gigantea TaxID=151771 RepID=UPI00106D1C22|nr:uncharacterized protein LOC114528384 [Dendronephthya gigantea]
MFKESKKAYFLSYFIWLWFFTELERLAASKLDNSRSATDPGRFGNAMDSILAINSRRKSYLNETESYKRDKIEHNIISANEAQEIADDLFEGDVILDQVSIPEDKELYNIQHKKDNALRDGDENAAKRQGTRNLKWLWHFRKVPYEISPSLYRAKYKILDAIRTFNSKTCVKFVPRKARDRNYVLFDKRQGCYSRIGRSYARPGPQIISIGQYCDYKDIIIHEMLHAVGFFHEQSRPDRQKHIKIHWQNIKKGFESEFKMYSHGQIDNLHINYNHNSVMHYGGKAFSKSPKLETMTAIDTPGKIKLGGSKMSALDVIELDALYRCKSNKVNEWTRWSSYGPCDKYCYKNRQRFCYGNTPKSCGGRPNRYGVESQYVKCTSSECPLKVGGNWGDWAPWSACSRTCNEGLKTRTRRCDNPAPKNNGKPCKGRPKQTVLCVKPRCHLDYDDTDFRNGRFGMWENDIYDTPGLNWIIKKGNTPTERTGPHSDHTTKKDYYLYVESSRRRRNDVARLISKSISKTKPGKRCFRFFYHMVGRTMGSLTLRLIIKDQPQRVLFTKKGPQGNGWRGEELTLDYSKPFKLAFEARLGRQPYSDIAIDDVFLDDGSCDCKDKYMVCKYWQKAGYCKRSFNYMYKNCKKSCNFCGCQNDPKWNYCRNWSFNECRKNRVWMEVHCPVTCRVCDCYDKNIWCYDWKAKGECTRNPNFMKSDCRKACGFCK